MRSFYRKDISRVGLVRELWYHIRSRIKYRLNRLEIRGQTPSDLGRVRSRDVVPRYRTRRKLSLGWERASAPSAPDTLRSMSFPSRYGQGWLCVTAGTILRVGCITAIPWVFWNCERR